MRRLLLILGWMIVATAAAAQSNMSGGTGAGGGGGCSVAGFVANHIIANDGAGNCTDAGFSKGNVIVGSTSGLQTIQATGANLTLNVNGGSSGTNPALASTCALTADVTDCVAESESAASTNGTLTNGLANQAILSSATATNSTATPLEVAQGSITNTVATPAMQVEATWNNASLAGEGFLLNLTNTASLATSKVFDLQVGNATMFSMFPAGQINFQGNGTITSFPQAAATNVGWKQCYYSSQICVGLDFRGDEIHTNNPAAGNHWFSLINQNSAINNNAGAAAPDTASGTSLASTGGVDAVENACSTNMQPSASHTAICPDSTAHEVLAFVNGSTSAGMLVRRQPGQVNSTGLTALVNTATLCAASAGACNVAGQYHIHINVWGSGTACGTPSPGGVTPSLTWTDENAVSHAAVVIPMMSQTGATTTAVNVTAPTVAFQSALANEGGSGDFTISTNGTVIQYAVAYAACGAGTGTYNLRASVTRLQ